MKPPVEKFFDGRKLLSVLLRPCPICEAPGFGVSDVITGLPCRRCEAPTWSAKAFRYACQQCGYSEEKWAPKVEKKQIQCSVMNVILKAAT